MFVTWVLLGVLGGVLAFPKLQIQDQPDISFPNVFVRVGYAGVPPSQSRNLPIGGAWST